MTLIRSLALLSCLVFITGCGGESGSKTAIPSANAAATAPKGTTGPITNADGTVTEGASAGKMQDPVE